jgi:hypothetical protein
MAETEKISAIDSRRYEKLKKEIHAWCDDRFRIGAALREINERKLYLEEHKTFDDFCLAEFGFKRAQAYRLIEAAGVKESVQLSPIGDKLINEGQARALALVPEEKRAEVLEKAAEDGVVTAKSIAAVAESSRRVPEKPEERLDKLGQLIPDSIVEDWDRAHETAKAMLSKISDLRSELKHALEEKDLIFAEVSNTTIADFTNAYTAIKSVTPYAVCPTCQGHHRKNCNQCLSKGFLSSYRFEQVVAIEIKKMLRGK